MQLSQRAEQAGSRVIKVINRLLAPASEIEAIAAAEEARAKVLAKTDELSGDKDIRDIQRIAAKRIIRRYSNKAAMSSGASGVISAVPVAFLAGMGADMAMTFKWQTEMSMALTALYGGDLHDPHIRDQAVALAGLGLLASNKKSKAAMTEQAFIEVAERQLQQLTAVALRKLIGRVVRQGAKRSLLVAAPFGAAAVVGASSGKLTTAIVGERINKFLNYQQQQRLTAAPVDIRSEATGNAVLESV